VLTIFILGTCITNAPRAGSFRGAWNYFAPVIGAIAQRSSCPGLSRAPTFFAQRD